MEEQEEEEEEGEHPVLDVDPDPVLTWNGEWYRRYLQRKERGKMIMMCEEQQ